MKKFKSTFKGENYEKSLYGDTESEILQETFNNMYDKEMLECKIIQLYQWSEEIENYILIQSTDVVDSGKSEFHE